MAKVKTKMAKVPGLFWSCCARPPANVFLDDLNRPWQKAPAKSASNFFRQFLPAFRPGGGGRAPGVCHGHLPQTIFLFLFLFFKKRLSHPDNSNGFSVYVRVEGSAAAYSGCAVAPLAIKALRNYYAAP